VATEQTVLAPGTGRLAAWLGRQVEWALCEVELSAAQYRLLGLLDTRPEVASVLADKLTVSRPSITTVVDGLVARGLVERGSAEGDRRRVTHDLTEAGRALLQEADRVVEQSLQHVIGEMEPRAGRSASAGLGALVAFHQQMLADWQPEQK
jgi:long-chain acyl-CoA synthetase